MHATRTLAEPTLVFDAPPAMAGMVEELTAVSEPHWPAMLDLFGLGQAGAPIKVLLAQPDSEAAQLAPSWAVGYALGSAGVVVLLPERVPTYPDGDLAQVLRHEVAHVLIARACAFQEIPRFFNEGLALYAARESNVEDQARLFFAAWSFSGVRLASLDRDFVGTPAEVARAYALSGAFVRFLLEREGEDRVAYILTAIAAGQSFEAAVQLATGRPLARHEELFFAHLAVWDKWLPLLSSSTLFSFVMILFVFLALKGRRRRNEEQRRRWLAEEAALAAIRARVAGPDEERDEHGQLLN